MNGVLAPESAWTSSTLDPTKAFARSVTSWVMWLVLAVWASLIQMWNDVGLFPVHTHAGIRRGILVHAPLHDLLQAHEPVGLTLGAGGLLFGRSCPLEDVVAADLLV